MKTTVILDNVPPHPNIEELCTTDGNIRCLAVPPSLLNHLCKYWIVTQN